ncbi:unnamed protein product [Cylicocyclus nassatus]|uniref:Nucleoside-diphosphate kinase n=1 Tax=Cylicocyclus nassatus TaxID=53992 RepID=A0AA36HGF3_CYLNA|nr:unnamed protein product [Cylicocyclus nassatus]
MGAEAKLYLHQHSIPQLFECLMTGLIYNRPKEPLQFLEQAIAQLRAHPEEQLSWDMFIERGELYFEKSLADWKGQEKLAKALTAGAPRTAGGPRPQQTKQTTTETAPKPKKAKPKEPKKEPQVQVQATSSPKPASQASAMGRTQRSPSVMKAAEVAQIPHVPVILFIGGPGGGKTRHAARVANALADQGLIHICMPDIIRTALAKYKDQYSEWKAANEHYLRARSASRTVGSTMPSSELIPNHLALALVKAEMGRHPEATAFFLEGFPREARQVEDFEREVKLVNMALILDYDEKTLREHMEKRGLGMEIIDQRIKEFKQKTLPSAKYFDDQHLLHLIPGEKDDHNIFERMRDLVIKAMSTGVPILTNQPSPVQTRAGSVMTPMQDPNVVMATTATFSPDMSRMPETPGANVQQTPDQAVQSQTPDQAVQSRTPDQAVQSQTPDQAVQGQTPDQAVQSQTPQEAPSQEAVQDQSVVEPNNVRGVTTRTSHAVVPGQFASNQNVKNQLFRNQGAINASSKASPIYSSPSVDAGAAASAHQGRYLPPYASRGGPVRTATSQGVPTATQGVPQGAYTPPLINQGAPVTVLGQTAPTPTQALPQPTYPQFITKGATPLQGAPIPTQAAPQAAYPNARQGIPFQGAPVTTQFATQGAYSYVSQGAIPFQAAPLLSQAAPQSAYAQVSHGVPGRMDLNQDASMLVQYASPPAPPPTLVSQGALGRTFPSESAPITTQVTLHGVQPQYSQSTIPIQGPVPMQFTVQGGYSQTNQFVPRGTVPNQDVTVPAQTVLPRAVQPQPSQSARPAQAAPPAARLTQPNQNASTSVKAASPVRPAAQARNFARQESATSEEAPISDQVATQASQGAPSDQAKPSARRPTIASQNATRHARATHGTIRPTRASESASRPNQAKQGAPQPTQARQSAIQPTRASHVIRPKQINQDVTRSQPLGKSRPTPSQNSPHSTRGGSGAQGRTTQRELVKGGTCSRTRSKIAQSNEGRGSERSSRTSTPTRGISSQVARSRNVFSHDARGRKIGDASERDSRQSTRSRTIGESRKEPKPDTQSRALNRQCSRSILRRSKAHSQDDFERESSSQVATRPKRQSVSGEVGIAADIPVHAAFSQTKSDYSVDMQTSTDSSLPGDSAVFSAVSEMIAGEYSEQPTWEQSMPAFTPPMQVAPSQLVAQQDFPSAVAPDQIVSTYTAFPQTPWEQPIFAHGYPVQPAISQFAKEQSSFMPATFSQFETTDAVTTQAATDAVTTQATTDAVTTQATTDAATTHAMINVNSMQPAVSKIVTGQETSSANALSQDASTCGAPMQEVSSTTVALQEVPQAVAPIHVVSKTKEQSIDLSPKATTAQPIADQAAIAKQQSVDNIPSTTQSITGQEAIMPDLSVQDRTMTELTTQVISSEVVITEQLPLESTAPSQAVDASAVPIQATQELFMSECIPDQAAPFAPKMEEEASMPALSKQDDENEVSTRAELSNAEVQEALTPAAPILNAIIHEDLVEETFEQSMTTEHVQVVSSEVIAEQEVLLQAASSPDVPLPQPPMQSVSDQLPLTTEASVQADTLPKPAFKNSTPSAPPQSVSEPAFSIDASCQQLLGVGVPNPLQPNGDMPANLNGQIAPSSGGALSQDTLVPDAFCQPIPQDVLEPNTQDQGLLGQELSNQDQLTNIGHPNSTNLAPSADGAKPDLPSDTANTEALAGDVSGAQVHSHDALDQEVPTTQMNSRVGQSPMSPEFPVFTRPSSEDAENAEPMPRGDSAVIRSVPSSSHLVDANRQTPHAVAAMPSTPLRTGSSGVMPPATVISLSNGAPVLLVIGAPGSQTFEIANRLAQQHEGFLFLSMGVLLRDKVKAEKEDELWQRVGRKIEKGEPVPMKLCRELLYDRINGNGATTHGLIIEGYPRTEAQLADIQAVLGRLDLAILVDCTEQFCIDNIAKKFQGNGNMVEDSPEVVKTRMALFKQNTLPMLKSLDEKGILRVIEGDSDVESVYSEVSTALDREIFNSNGKVEEVA